MDSNTAAQTGRQLIANKTTSIFTGLCADIHVASQATAIPCWSPMNVRDCSFPSCQHGEVEAEKPRRWSLIRNASIPYFSNANLPRCRKYD